MSASQWPVEGDLSEDSVAGWEVRVHVSDQWPAGSRLTVNCVLYVCSDDGLCSMRQVVMHQPLTVAPTNTTHPAAVNCDLQHCL